MISYTTFTARGDADPRVAELSELAASEGVKIAARIDIILWFEDRGYVVDLITGVAMNVSIERVTPSGVAVNHLLSPVTDDEIEQTVIGLFAGDTDGDIQSAIDYADKDVCFYDYDGDDRFDGSIEDDHDFIRRGC